MPMPTTVTYSDLFNIQSKIYIKDPYQCFSYVRERTPVFRTPYGVYVLTKYQDIVMALGSKKLTKNYWGSLEAIYGKSCHQEEGFKLISDWLTNLNPPEHTKLRKLVSMAMSTKKIAHLEKITSDIANRLIDSFYLEGKTDLLKSYAFRLPALVICSLLGIADQDFDFVFKRIHMPNVLLNPVYQSRKTLDIANLAVKELKEYFQRLCKERMNHPGDDLISELLLACREMGISPESEEVVSNVFFLFGSGYETTMNLICNALITLFSHPEALESFKKDHSLFPQILEEVLRYQSPVLVASPSQLIEDIELSGVVIPKGQVIIPILGSANRDPEEYKDPDSFDMHRNPKKLLAFGYGSHLCLGTHLARLEVRIAIEELFKRIPNLRVENPENPEWIPHVGLRGVKFLMGAW